MAWKWYYPNITIGGIDVTDRAFRVSLSSDVDMHGWQCEIEMHNHPDQSPDLSQVIEPGQVVQVRIVETTTHHNPGGGTLVFEGLTGDSIASNRVVDQNDVVIVRCRGKSQKILQDFFILDERVYPIAARDPDKPWVVKNENAFASAVQVANEILSENFIPVTLTVLHDPNFMVYPYKVAEISAWDALQNLFAPTGFVIVDMMTSSGSQLTLLDPLAAGSTYTLDEYSATSLDKSDANVRNRVRVYWRSRDPDADKAAGALVPPGAPEGIFYVEVNDAASQAKYGVRPMKIAEEQSSLIDTYAEALAFANSVLNDLAEIAPSDQVEAPGALYQIKPYDKVTLTKTQGGTVQVTGVQYELSPGGIARTTISGVRKPIREYETHITREARARAKASNETAQTQFRVGARERAAMAQIGKRMDGSGIVDPPEAHGGILEVSFTFPRVKKDERGKPNESLARYKVYYKYDIEENSPIPEIDVEDKNTYDGTVYVDNEIVTIPVKRVKDDQGNYHNQIVAVKITALDRMGRENVPSLQAEGKALAYRVPVAIDAGVIRNPTSGYTFVWQGKQVTVPEDHFWVVQVVPMEPYAIIADPLMGEVNSIVSKQYGIFEAHDQQGNSVVDTVLEPGTYTTDLRIYHEIALGGIEDPGWGEHQFLQGGDLMIKGNVTTKADDFGFVWPQIVDKKAYPSVFWIVWQVPK
jgi:hypothetical protein